MFITSSLASILALSFPHSCSPSSPEHGLRSTIENAAKLRSSHGPCLRQHRRSLEWTQRCRSHFARTFVVQASRARSSACRGVTSSPHSFGSIESTRELKYNVAHIHMALPMGATRRHPRQPLPASIAARRTLRPRAQCYMRGKFYNVSP